jgi:type II secretory pathway pseudopilin PulG
MSLRGAGPRGYSLVEAAIVLGIIGVVAASLFAYLGPARNRAKVNLAVDELNLIADNVRSLYSGRAYPASLAACPATFASVNHLPGTNWTLADHAKNRVFPPEMLYTVSGTTYVNNSLKGAKAATTADVDLCGSNPVLFAVRYRYLTEKNCVDALMRTAALGSGIGLYQIYINGSKVALDAVAGTVGLDKAESASVCGQAGSSGVDVVWYFKFEAS